MIVETKTGFVTIVKIDSGEEHLLKKIYQLRVVCRNELGYITYEKYPNGWKDELDDSADHFLAMDGSAVIGAGRVNLLERITDHPYYLAIEDLITKDLFKNGVGYISRDDVLHEYRGNGIQKAIFNARYELCVQKNITDVLIDIPIVGYQLGYYLKEGYNSLGLMKTSKIKWELGDSILMHKRL